MIRRAAIRVILPAVLLLTILFGVVGWIGSERALHPHYYKYKWTLATYPDLHPQTIRIHSQTGIDLSGRFFRADGSATIILASGYGDTQDQMLPFVEFLHRAGFNTLTYNMRARANSGGKFVTLGLLEQKDMISALDYLSSRPDVDSRHIGVLGISMGGAVAILAAAKDRRIARRSRRLRIQRRARSDCDKFRALHPPARLPLRPFDGVDSGFKSRHRREHSTSVDVIGSISPRPLLIIHGLNDQVVPPANSERNFARARQPKQLW